MTGSLDIIEVTGRSILNSNKNPAIEAEVVLENGAHGRAAVSMGSQRPAWMEVDIVNERLSQAVLYEDASDQEEIDRILLKTAEDKSAQCSLGVLAISMAVARAAGAGMGMPLYRYLGGTSAPVMPIPMMSMISGKDAERGIDSGECLVVPQGAKTYSEGLRMGVEIYQTLKRLLIINGYRTTKKEEGSFILHMANSVEALHILTDAVKICGYKPGIDVLVADDFFVTSRTIIDMEQAGCVTVAMKMVKKARKSGLKVIISDNLGEAGEPFPADLAAAVHADYIKSGVPCPGECSNKYHELLRIEEFYKKHKLKGL